MVLDVLQNGIDLYKLSDGSLASLIGSEHGRTDIKDSRQASWLRQEIQRKVSEGMWCLLPESEAHKFCIIKAFVIPKPRRPDAFRDVWDERPVNLRLPRRRFKFETLETVARMLGKDWWFATRRLTTTSG